MARISKAIAVRKNTGVPAHLSKYGAIGAEDINMQDEIRVPFIKVVQKMSQEVDEGLAEYGQIINSATKEVISDENNEIRIIVLKAFINYKAFDPDSYALLASGNTWKEFVESAEASGIEIEADKNWKYKFYNFFVVIDGDNVPYQLSLGKTSAKTGNKLLNMIQQQCYAKGLPIFGKIFTLFVQEQETNKKKYLVWGVSSKEEDIVSENMADIAADKRKIVDSAFSKITAEEATAVSSEADVEDEKPAARTKAASSVRRRRI